LQGSRTGHPSQKNLSKKQTRRLQGLDEIAISRLPFRTVCRTQSQLGAVS
jgi:hypothetical protein